MDFELNRCDQLDRQSTDSRLLILCVRVFEHSCTFYSVHHLKQCYLYKIYKYSQISVRTKKKRKQLCNSIDVYKYFSNKISTNVVKFLAMYTGAMNADKADVSELN